MATRAIIHLDMDAFYASVEQRDNPALRGKPVIVGGALKRGVVCAASYEARPFGVRSALPMARAVALCPQAVVVEPRFAAYEEASRQVFSIFETVTPLIEPISLDEAFLDVTGSIALRGSASSIATSLRDRIAKEVHLPSSAGIASVKFVAKIVSDLAKPNGQKEVLPEETLAFLAPLAISRVWGVGPKMEATLAAMGLTTIGALAQADPRWLESRLGPTGRHFHDLSRGIDPREVIPDREAKSIGSEETFVDDLRGSESLAPHLHDQALRVGRRLRKAGLLTRVVQLKIRFSDFELVTRRATLEPPTDDGQRLYREALTLLERVPKGRAIRLTGVSAQELTAGVHPRQRSLFDEAPAPSKAKQLNSALDRITAKFGAGAITTADLVDAENETEVDEATRSKMGMGRLR